MEKERQNTIRIVGTLVENKLRENVAKGGASAGKSFISGDIVVKSVIDGKDEFFPVRLYAFDTTQAGQPNKLYSSYKNLSNLLNRRVVVSGYLSENRFYSIKTKAIAAEQRLNGRFISEAPLAETADSATFVFSGYVASALAPKTRKGETTPYAYQIICGQENSKATTASMFHFDVSPDRTDIVDYIKKSYAVGQTVKFSGDIRFVTQKVVKEQKNVAFGTPTAQAFTVTNKSFLITSGDAPISGDTAYDMPSMQKYKSTRVEADMELQNSKAAAAKNDGDDASEDSEQIAQKPAVASLI